MYLDFEKRHARPAAPDQLRTRSRYKARDACVLVDDHDLATGASGNPPQPLLEYLPFARGPGPRPIIARSA
ncbi:hypothetical protein [Streptomyces sp. CT34]|uniref:hypothetical protein n=1 Tax=Streptomyces sp. CT34 TaxID=1553907 RepID=UPI0005BE4473|nr:hypothetical protein [Streptomyces sp. CT34]